MSRYGGGSEYYSDEAPRRRRRRTRRPVYEEKIVESRQGRGQPPLQQALVRRPRSDSSDSIEEIQREFDPESGAFIQRQRTYRDRNGDQYRDSRPPPSNAGYSQKSRHSGRRRQDSYDSYDSYDSRSEDSRDRRSRRPSPKRRQSVGEKALEAIGLGGAATAIADKVRGRSKSRPRGDRGRDDSSDSYYYDRRTQSAGPNRGRSQSRGVDKRKRIEDAAKAALAAAAVEAWRSRKNVGGEAGKRILTAAIGAAGIDAVVQQKDRHGNRNALASAIGGLATNRLVNGRSRSRSRPGKRDTGNGGTALSVAALAALAGKAIKDHGDRSKSRSRGGNDNDDYYGSDADEDYSRDKRSGQRKKSLSEHFHGPTDRILAKLGFPESENHKDCYYVDKYGRRHYSDDENEDVEGDGPRLRGGGEDDSSDSDSCSTDSYSSDEEHKKIKKMRNKGLITGGLAAVATIHAAHSVYSSMEAREKRHKKVLEGKMTPEEARRLKSRAALQDVAAVGIAALGIKGALSEWKEVKEHRGSMQSRNIRLEEMRAHREEKRKKGEWDEDLWRRKREQRARSHGRGVGAGAAVGAIGNGDDDRRSDSRNGGRRAIEDGRDGGGSSRAGRGRSRGRQRDDDYSDEDDDDDYYEPRSRRGYRNSLPPDFSRGNRYRDREYKYDPVDGGKRGTEYTDGPLYADGNPYATMSRSSALREQLPPPPFNYRSAPRY